MSVIHAPVLSPRYSTIFAARGMEVCTHPAALHNTSTWRRPSGAANGLSGSAAIIPAMSHGFANCFCGQPVVNPPVNPSGGQGLDGACCANSTPPSNTTSMHTATLNVFTMVETPVLEHYLDSDVERNWASARYRPRRVGRAVGNLALA